MGASDCPRLVCRSLRHAYGTAGGRLATDSCRQNYVDLGSNWIRKNAGCLSDLHRSPGAHLALSLERLDHLTGKRLTRIGLSATRKPIELVAHFLTGNDRPDPTVVQIGHRRELDLAVEVPGSELGPVASNEMWAEIYDRLATLATQHRSTLVFVNTRRLAERVAHHLAERLGKEAVAAHHGSLSRKLRLVAEKKLKAGEIRALVATASLELGIDIGSVDLLCQIGSPPAISLGLQRIGRAGHWRR